MVVDGILNTISQMVNYVATEAPKPLRIIFFLLLFISMGYVVKMFIVDVNHVCVLYNATQGGFLENLTYDNSQEVLLKMDYLSGVNFQISYIFNKIWDSNTTYQDILMTGISSDETNLWGINQFEVLPSNINDITPETIINIRCYNHSPEPYIMGMRLFDYRMWLFIMIIMLFVSLTIKLKGGT